MTLLTIGISQRTAPVALRERLTFSDSTLRQVLTRFAQGQGPLAAHLAEVAILSTCNRLEIYAVTSPQVASGDSLLTMVNQFIAETQGVPLADFASHVYYLTDADAARHLHRVAAGLESIVLGESQILGQVAQAYELANSLEATGPTFATLFRGAVRAGKRARTETAIGRNSTQFSAMTVRLAEEAVGDLTNKQIVVVGAGAIGALVAQALAARGLRQLVIVNRSPARAADLARGLEAHAQTLDALPNLLQTADAIFYTTSAPHYLLEAAQVSTALAHRRQPLALMDLSVPRNIDPAVTGLAGVQLFNLDEVQSRLVTARAEREGEVPKVETIVAEEMAHFANWQTAAVDLLPLISDLRQNAERIRQKELARALHALPDVDDATRQQMEALTVSLVNKLLHEPTRHLRTESRNGDTATYVHTVRELFGLERAQEQEH